MEPNIEEVAGRIRALREDLDITMQEKIGRAHV